MINQRFTWKKTEKLKSRKRIDRVFREGKNFSLFPYRVYYLRLDAAATAPAPFAAAPTSILPLSSSSAPPEVFLQAGFVVSKRHFKKAVDRNRIKRLGREAYRLQKRVLSDRLKEKQLPLALFFIYTGRDLPDQILVKEKIGVILQKLVKEIG